MWSTQVLWMGASATTVECLRRSLGIRVWLWHEKHKLGTPKKQTLKSSLPFPIIPTNQLPLQSHPPPYQHSQHHRLLQTQCIILHPPFLSTKLPQCGHSLQSFLSASGVNSSPSFGHSSALCSLPPHLAQVPRLQLG
jgi:hypothetical protein